MWGDDIKNAVDTINKYLKNGNNIYLWDKKSDKLLLLDGKSELDFELMPAPTDNYDSFCHEINNKEERNV